MKYELELDTTYQYMGARSTEHFDDFDLAVAAYHAARRGFAALLEVHGDGRRRLAKDSEGRKYIKGSPFYDFPHVPHRSIVDDKEIPTT